MIVASVVYTFMLLGVVGEVLTVLDFPEAKGIIGVVVMIMDGKVEKGLLVTCDDGDAGGSVVTESVVI